MMHAEASIEIPDWNPSDPHAIAAWENISRQYALGASGHVRVVLGKELRPGNVWEGKEFNTLIANPNVKRITAIDPSTRMTNLIYPE
jgi:hypothetical protein